MQDNYSLGEKFNLNPVTVEQDIINMPRWNEVNLTLFNFEYINWKSL